MPANCARSPRSITRSLCLCVSHTQNPLTVTLLRVAALNPRAQSVLYVWPPPSPICVNVRTQMIGISSGEIIIRVSYIHTYTIANTMVGDGDGAHAARHARIRITEGYNFTHRRP